MTVVAGVGIWATHGVHAGVAVISAATFGGGLLVEHRAIARRPLGTQVRARQLQASLANGAGLWHGIPGSPESGSPGSGSPGSGSRESWSRESGIPGSGCSGSGPSLATAAPVSLAALGATGAALVHLAVTPGHFSQWWLYGVFFLVTALLQLAWAVTVTLRPSPQLLQAGIAGSAGVVLLWLFTRVVAVPVGPGAGTREAVGGLDVVAGVFELLTVAAGVACLRGFPRSRRVSAGRPA